MEFYHVAVASHKYQGKDYLTYHFTDSLPVGSVVAVPLRHELAAGIVISKVVKPVFPTKTIDRALNIAVPEQTVQLLVWLKSYYPSPLGLLTGMFLPTNLLHKPKNTYPPRPAQAAADLPPLTPEQQAAIQQIMHSRPQTFLLHGRTGSGKTRVYIELMKDALAKGRSVLVLTPEIALTPQLVGELAAQFSNQVVITHSNLPAAERRDTWTKIAQSQLPLVVVGPRSAVFSPLANTGLIIMDESHEPAYKQEQAPYYQTTRVASTLASLHSAYLVMGSATPLITDFFYAEQKGLPIITMSHRASTASSETAKVELINLRDKQQFSRHRFLSNRLLEAINKALSNGEQALIFLNRRGSARLVLCSACGWQALCPKCDLPLTYHGDFHNLQCHTCGHKSAVAGNCPSCGSSDILFRSMGTKALTEALTSYFPRAVIKRFDTDTGKDERIEAIYQEVASGQVDILVGTQILAKGLDLPLLSVVGVVFADTSLSFPDYTAEERTYQLLNQIIGRVGRGHRGGEVIVQTYNPDSPTIQAATSSDWPLFYKTQISERASFGFPPFVHVLKLTIARARPKTAEDAAQALAKQLQESYGKQIEVVGPSPAFYARLSGKYRWQIVVKAKRRPLLTAITGQLPAGWIHDLDPSDLL